MADCSTRASTADHIIPRKVFGGWLNGSTRRWRKVRSFVLDRDGYRCQLPVDAAGNYDRDADTVAADPVPVTDPDDPRNLRASCQLHNQQRNDGTDRAATFRRRHAGPTWEW